MTRPKPVTLQWCLRDRMRQAGILSVAELYRRLGEDRVLISQVQLGRLVQQLPLRLNVRVLQSVCRVLECAPGDLLSWEGADQRPEVGAGQKASRSSRPSPTGEEIQQLVGPAFRLHRKGV